MTIETVISDPKGFPEEYFRAYADAYLKGGGSALFADLYHSPSINVRGDGSVHCLRTPAETRQFFQAVADANYRDGCRNWRFRNVEVQQLGARSALVTVDWEMLREDGSVIRAWRHSYHLIRVDGGWRILASAVHGK